MQIAKPIIYGTIASWLGKKADEKKTHQWICYVRGLNNEDLSYLIEKVIFVLHSSFENPNRGKIIFYQNFLQSVVHKDPFVMCATGWGQFEIIIKIYLKYGYDQPLVVNHMLKLYPTTNTNQPPSKKPVVSEQYDEIVFINPHPDILPKLSLIPNPKENRMEVEQQPIPDTVDLEQQTPEFLLRYYQPHFTDFDEKESMQSIEKALNIVTNELLLEAKRKNQILDMEIQELQLEIEKLQAQS